MKKGKVVLVPVTKPEEGLKVVWEGQILQLNGQDDEDSSGYQENHWLVGTDHANESYEPLHVFKQLAVEYWAEPAGENVWVNQMVIRPEDWEWALEHVGEEVSFEEVWGNGNEYYPLIYGKQGYAKLITAEPGLPFELIGKPGKGKSYATDPESVEEIIPDLADLLNFVSEHFKPSQTRKHQWFYAGTARYERGKKGYLTTRQIIDEWLKHNKMKQEKGPSSKE